MKTRDRVHFSVITITKNDPQGLSLTQKSVEAQSYQNYEWIVIDGTHEADEGIYDAMNKGLDRAQGDYVIFMNGGDCFADETILAQLSRYDADFIYGDAVEDGLVKPARHDRAIDRGMITHHQAMVYRRSVIGARRFDTRLHIAADYKFTWDHLCESRLIYAMAKPLCVFQTGGLSSQQAALGRREETMIRQEMGVKSPLRPWVQWGALIIKRVLPRVYFKIRFKLLY